MAQLTEKKEIILAFKKIKLKEKGIQMKCVASNVLLKEQTRYLLVELHASVAGGTF